MLTLHQWTGVVVIAVCVAAGALALLARWQPLGGAYLVQLLALTQTLLGAQALIGLFLVLDDEHAEQSMHYAYGVFAIIAVVAPWLYAPRAPRQRLLWFGGASLVAALLAVRAYQTA
jgi:hypothetical protein